MHLYYPHCSHIWQCFGYQWPQHWMSLHRPSCQWCNGRQLLPKHLRWGILHNQKLENTYSVIFWQKIIHLASYNLHFPQSWLIWPPMAIQQCRQIHHHIFCRLYFWVLSHRIGDWQEWWLPDSVHPHICTNWINIHRHDHSHDIRSYHKITD